MVLEVEPEVPQNWSCVLEGKYGDGDLDAVDAVHSAPRGHGWTICKNLERDGGYMDGR